ncbi:hypothetical protein ACFV0L_29340 [Streptosporangium canum]|uniref:hypothetical protein n=1 Tax=Streptosporangium canum TaxID=324952 RepID=UPI0036D09387
MVEANVRAEALVALGKALKQESDGKAMRRDLIRELKKPLAPAVAEIKAGLMSISSGGLPADGQPMRRTVARRIATQVKLSGRLAGVRVRARKTPELRGFANAAKRLNSPKGFRHQVFGSNRWVVQFGRPNYFDDPLTERRAEFRQGVLDTMQATAQRIADNSTRG